MKCVDGRGKNLIIGDLVAIPTAEMTNASKRCTFAEILNINNEFISGIGNVFHLSFKNKRLTRYSYQVLKLEQ
jgi:hypothetical protein